MKVIEGGVCAAKGFKAGGMHCGVKKSQTKNDVAIIVSEKECSASAVYTTNRVKASPILLTKEHLENGIARAVICNSGNANACAPFGMENARRQAKAAARFLGVDEQDVIVASTGVIGQTINVGAIEENVDKMVLSEEADGSVEAAKAIMTTDTKMKTIAYEFEIDGTVCHIGGICKGSGMIHPNMGTMLCFITTDAAISPKMIKQAILTNVKKTFNRVTVDGDTSTNDMCALMANGMAGNAEITEEGPAYEQFLAALRACMQHLAICIAADGEGASRLMTVTVSGAKDEQTAEILAKSITSSSLTKAAMFGSDANWGRVLCAMGYSGAEFDVEKVTIGFASADGQITCAEDGRGLDFDEDLAKKILSADAIEINATLSEGDGTATCWGCDLTYDYVKINGDYRS